MFFQAVRTGAKNGLKQCWMLIKIIVPVFVAITFIKHTPVMEMLARAFRPMMGIFNLPGEAAVPWITGMFLDEYASIAAIKAVGLAGADITILTIMSVMAHSLFIESAIIKKLGLSMLFFIGYRLLLAVILGILFGFVGGRK